MKQSLLIWIYREYALFPRSLNVCKFVENIQEFQISGILCKRYVYKDLIDFDCKIQNSLLNWNLQRQRVVP